MQSSGGAGSFFAIALVASLAGFGAGLVWPPQSAGGPTPERTQAIHRLPPTVAAAAIRVGSEPAATPHPVALSGHPTRGGGGGLDPELRERWEREGERARAQAQREASIRSEVGRSTSDPSPGEVVRQEPSADAAVVDRPARRVVESDAPLSMALEFEHSEDVRGAVQLRLEVGADGAVRDVVVVSSDPVNTALERAAVDAARQWRYEPALRDGRPVDVGLLVTIKFEPRP